MHRATGESANAWKGTRDAVARCAALRVIAHPQGSRTRPGLYAVAHFVGLRVVAVRTKGSRTRRGFMLSPAAQACGLSRCVPTARGLAVGFMLSPTSWAFGLSRCVPTAREIAVGFMLSPTSWAEPGPSPGLFGG